MSGVTLPPDFAERLAAVREEMRGLGRPDARLIAVTKAFPPTLVAAAVEAGVTDVGENYAQEVIEKRDAFGGAAVHFIGRIQRNKVRKIADRIDWWHSVDRAEIVVEIGKRAPGSDILLQVNAADDPTKAGAAPEALPELLDVAAASGVVVRGLMTIGVLGDADATRRAFVDTRRIADDLGLVECSMGMSGDYRDALVEGSTMIRVGSALFGPRPG